MTKLMIDIINKKFYTDISALVHITACCLIINKSSYTVYLKYYAHSSHLTLCCDFMHVNYTHILQDYCTDTGTKVLCNNEATMENMDK